MYMQCISMSFDVLSVEVNVIQRCNDRIQCSSMLFQSISMSLDIMSIYFNVKIVHLITLVST